MIKCYIDVRELKRIDLFKEYCEDKALDFDIQTMKLSSGDFVFEKNNKTVAFEYKTSQDLISSIVNKRVFDEIYRCSCDYNYSYLLCESNYEYAMNQINYSTHYKFDNRQLQGAFARIRCYCPIIEAKNPNNIYGNKKDKIAYKYCFDKMVLQVQKCLDGNTPYLREKHSIKDKNPAVSLLVFCSGISLATAKKIAKQLNITTIQQLFNLTTDDLTSIKGIGNKKAEQILNDLVGGFT